MYRILLADDEGIMLESLKKIIETEYGNECEIHCAGDFSDSVKSLRRIHLGRPP